MPVLPNLYPTGPSAKRAELISALDVLFQWRDRSRFVLRSTSRRDHGIEGQATEIGRRHPGEHLSFALHRMNIGSLFGVRCGQAV